ncbi:DUF29 family protein [Aerosakkonemataceae cyanobacterium BLCC-F50]|uniref:DUF29 family protein n=1 Tax=Floridaenema flaviceps BLCC-F50 TaxID=3153642 RepID=A0ABV4XUA8_9CYAN
MATIREQRRKVTDLLQESPSLKSSLDEILKKAWADGRDLAVRETLMELRTFPSEISYTWQEIENPDFFPGVMSDSDTDLLN